MRISTLSILSCLLIGYSNIVNAQQPSTRGQVPIPGKPVYVKETNSIWIFSFSKNIPADNKLSYIDLSKSFNTLSPPVMDKSSLITNNLCPVMHFAQAISDHDGKSINIFGAGSDVNGNYSPTMTLCQFNSQTNSWKEIVRPNNTPPARRNAALEITQSGLTVFWGGSSEAITGLSPTIAGYPNIWHQDVSIFDFNNGWVNGPVYNGPARANATITQISDTNGQLVIIGGSIINNNSAADMVTNFPLANMSDIVVLDPRTSTWTNIAASGISPTPRKHHTTTLHPDGHTLILIGGETFNSSGAYVLNDVWTLDTKNMNNYSWTQVNTGGDPGLYRSNHTSILINDQIWVIAGTNQSAKAVDIQLLNTTNWSWSYNAVSNDTASEAYQSIGGVKGLVGIIVGVLGSCLLACSCLTFWWCRRRRVDPSSTKYNKSSNSETMYVDHEGHLQQSMVQQQNNQNNSTMDHSKITSRPSLSTTTSGGLAALNTDWNNQTQHMNNFGASPSPTNHQGPNYYVPQYTVGTPIIPIADHHYYSNNNDNYYDNNGYLQDNNHPPPPPFGSTTGAVYTPDIQQQQQQQHQHRQSLGSFWESNPQHSSHLPEGNTSDHHNFLLTPMHEQQRVDARPNSRIQQSQVLQKPNELDTVNDPRSPTSGSTTVYSNSTSEEHSEDRPIYDSLRTNNH